MTFPALAPDAWAWALAAALFGGMAKTGVPGLGVLAVPLMAQAVGAKPATGVLLPVLMCADVMGVLTYRQGADWKQIGRLLRWAVPGIAIGTLVLQKIDKGTMAHLLGGMLLALIVLAALRRLGKLGNAEEGLPGWVAPPTGLLGGFTTMVANAAGPVMNLYLLAMRLPKEVFLPTAAWFFFLINWIKVPFGVYAGVIDLRSFALSASLFPITILGGLLGRWVAKKIDQKLFESLAWGLTVLSALRFLAG